MDFEVKAICMDAGISGRKMKNRPELQNALDDVCQCAGVVVVYTGSGKKKMDLIEIAHECDKALQTHDTEKINDLICKIDSFNNNIIPSQKCTCHYLLGNLYSGLSRINQEKSDGWRSDKFPKNLSTAINHYRQAEKYASQSENAILSEIQTNLANELAHQRRNIEILDTWHCDFDREGDSPYVSTLSKARELIWISRWLNDPSHRQLYLYEAYLLLSELKNRLPDTDHPEVIATMENDKQILSLLQHGKEHFQGLKNWQKQYEEEDYPIHEKQYRQWCLQNNLFVNPINDLTKEWIADQDILQFPDHTVDVNAGPYLSAAFSALKREYCFSRFIAYEGIHQIHPEYENRKLFLTDTLDYVHYSGSTEKIKTAFRICFSVLDSLAFLMNSYFKCAAKRVAFSSLWIKEHMKDKNNFFIDALYWLACDLTEIPEAKKKNWRAPNPTAEDIRKIRNAIEHGWLRVSEQKNSIWSVDSDFSYQTTPSKLEKRTLFLLKLVRSAIMYFCMAVSLEEETKINSGGLIVKTPITLIPDDFITHNF